MKILHVIDSAGLYGAENMLLDLASEQLGMDCQPVIASIGVKGEGEKAIEREAAARGIRAKRFRMRAGPNLAGALMILRFAHREQMDLLHSHGYKGNILLGAIPRRWRRLPLVTTLHGYTSLDRLTRMKMYECLDARLLRRHDEVVLVDAAQLQHPRLQNCRGVRFQVIHNGLCPPPPASSHSLDPELEAYCLGGPTIGALGRLSPEKGFLHLLLAVRQVRDRGVDARLVIFGEGRERERLQERIGQLDLKGRALLAGYRPEARHYLPLCRIFALSSYTEGMPITILEAMQAGVPIVATRVGAVPEVLDGGTAGVLVEPGSAGTLADGLRVLLQNPELGRRLAARARIRVAESYSSRRMARQYEEIYRRLLPAGNIAYA